MSDTRKFYNRFFYGALLCLLFAGPILVLNNIRLFNDNSLFFYGMMISLITIGASLMLLFFFPANVDLKNHLRTAILLFGSVTAFNAFSLLRLLSYPIVDIPLAALSMGSLICSFMMTYGIKVIHKKFPGGIENLSLLPSAERSLVVRGNTLFEWMVLFINVAWFFLVGIMV